MYLSIIILVPKNTILNSSPLFGKRLVVYLDEPTHQNNDPYIQA